MGQDRTGAGRDSRAKAIARTILMLRAFLEYLFLASLKSLKWASSSSATLFSFSVQRAGPKGTKAPHVRTRAPYRCGGRGRGRG